MIKQGYMVQITSWENDGDCYNTKIFDGLSAMQAFSLAAFCEFLQNCVSNQPESLSEVDFSKFEYFTEYVGFSGWDGPTNQEYFEELAAELVGYGYETSYLRVLDSYKVYLIPSDIYEIKF